MFVSSTNLRHRCLESIVTNFSRSPFRHPVSRVLEPHRSLVYCLCSLCYIGGTESPNTYRPNIHFSPFSSLQRCSKTLLSLKKISLSLRSPQLRGSTSRPFSPELKLEHLLECQQPLPNYYVINRSDEIITYNSIK